MPTKQEWNTYSEILRRHLPGARHEQEVLVQKLQELVRPGITWLDAGCGHSLVPAWLKGGRQIEEIFLDRAGLLVGCDVDAISLGTPSRIRRIACNLEQLAFRSETFDLVSANMVVEHLENPGRVFAEIYRVLKPGGVAIFLTPNLYHWTTVASRLTPYWFHRWLVKRFEGREEEDVFPTRYRCNTARAFRTLLGAAGLANVEVDLVVCLPRLVRFPLLLRLECLLYRMTEKVPALREVLCVAAQKPAACDSMESVKRPAYEGKEQEEHRCTRESP